MTDVVVEYLGALQAERGASRNTLSAYRRDLADFSQFLNDHHRSLRRAGPDDIVGYLESEFHISIADEDLSPENFETITRLTALVEQKLGKARTEA